MKAQTTLSFHGPGRLTKANLSVYKESLPHGWQGWEAKKLAELEGASRVDEPGHEKA